MIWDQQNLFTLLGLVYKQCIQTKNNVRLFSCTQIWVKRCAFQMMWTHLSSIQPWYRNRSGTKAKVEFFEKMHTFPCLYARFYTKNSWSVSTQSLRWVWFLTTTTPNSFISISVKLSKVGCTWVCDSFKWDVRTLYSLYKLTLQTLNEIQPNWLQTRLYTFRRRFSFTITSCTFECVIPPDINECERTSSCLRGRCTNKMGSYHCECQKGYTLVGGRECQGQSLHLPTQNKELFLGFFHLSKVEW